jgi:CubicO group peptidase (beta-lactamase class C family)
MQQVEEGKLNLNTDVNTYLTDVQIPATFPQPITLKDLLTHTPGFDDLLGLFAHTADEVRPLAEILKAQVPNRVRPPGTLPSYSNHGAALAGYAVACVSGLSREDYLEERILRPLGMDHTLVRQPPEDKLPAGTSKGHKWHDGRFDAKGFEYFSRAAVPARPANERDVLRVH